MKNRNQIIATIIIALTLVCMTPIFNIRHAFGTQASLLPSVSSCGYYRNIEKEWLANSVSLGYGIFAILLDDGNVQMREVSVWVEKTGEWAAIVTHWNNDPQYGRILWSCIAARGQDWSAKSHFNQGLPL